MVEETVDLNILGQCEMMLRDIVQRQKVTVQGLEQLEVFRRVSSRLPKMLKEEAEVDTRLRNKSEQEEAIDALISSKLKAGEEQVSKNEQVLRKGLEAYRGTISNELDKIKGDKDFAQGEYINMKAGLDTALKNVRDEIQIARKELQDAETAKENVKKSIGEMARTAGVLG